MAPGVGSTVGAEDVGNEVGERLRLVVKLEGEALSDDDDGTELLVLLETVVVFNSSLAAVSVSSASSSLGLLWDVGEGELIPLGS